MSLILHCERVTERINEYLIFHMENMHDFVKKKKKKHPFSQILVIKIYNNKNDNNTLI